MDNVPRLENIHTGEVPRMSRVCDIQGQIVLRLEGSLPKSEKRRSSCQPGRPQPYPRAFLIVGATQATTRWSLAAR